MNDLISIVLPVYNGSKYLSESIESILSQTYKNWELIIIDDCSSDNTPQIANRYCTFDSRIRYYKNENNLRLPRALNKGFSLAKGDFFTWTSDDNIYEKDALEKMLYSLKSNNADFVFCSYNTIDENGEIIGFVRVPDDFKNSIVGSNIVGACFLYTRKVYNSVGDYQHGRILVEDYDYWARIISTHKTVVINNEQLYRYRVHPGSLTGSNASSTISAAMVELILYNKRLYKRFNLAQKYFYYSGLARHSFISGKRKYSFKACLYKYIYWYPRRLKEKFTNKSDN